MQCIELTFNLVLKCEKTNKILFKFLGPNEQMFFMVQWANVMGIF